MVEYWYLQKKQQGLAKLKVILKYCHVPFYDKPTLREDMNKNSFLPTLLYVMPWIVFTIFHICVACSSPQM